MINRINERVAKLADGEKVYYLDIGPQFLAEDGTLLVGLALQGLRDLGRMHLALEDPGEGQADHAFEPSLEALQHTPSRSFALGRRPLCQPRS